MSTQPKPLSPLELDCIRGRDSADKELARETPDLGPPALLRTMEDRSALLSHIAYLEGEAKKKDEAAPATILKAILAFDTRRLDPDGYEPFTAATDLANAIAAALGQTNQEGIEK
jgi:hypothetical protein